MAKMYSFDSEMIIDQSIEKVFEFFSKAENLEIITPAWLQFKIATPLPIDMHPGTLIDYNLKLYGLPFKWKTEITHWDPPNRFVDSQIKGPYIAWVHEHIFTDLGDKTKMEDHVDYAIPGWLFSPIIHKFFVRKNVESIFRYRTNVIRTQFVNSKS